jgi:DNA polymerase-1
LGKQLGCTAQEAKEMLNSFFYKFRQIRDFMNDTIAKAKRLHYVTSLSKRKRMLPHINAEDPEVRLK